MTRWVLVAALSAALVGCGDAAEESDDPAPAETAAASPAAAASAASSAGNYEVTAADGTRFIATLNADGTYQDTAADGAVMEKGTWEDRADGKTCFDPEGDEMPVTCFTVGEQQPDGTMTATPDSDSGPLKIRRTS